MVGKGLFVIICFDGRVFRKQTARMTAPSVRDIPTPARHIRRRMRLRADFENSVLASSLADDESVVPVESRPAAPTTPTHGACKPPRTDKKKADIQKMYARPFLASGHDHLDDWIDEASKLSRIARYAAIVGAITLTAACAMVLTRGLAGAVWEFVARN
jgi:hypothetical protein